LNKVLEKYDNVEVDAFSGLLVDYTNKKNCSMIIRGLRAVSDYEYELQMAHINSKLSKDIETMFMVSRNEYSHLSSSIVKEVANFGGDISCFVPEHIEMILKEKIS